MIENSAPPPAPPRLVAYPQSTVELRDTTICLARSLDDQQKVLVVGGDHRGFQGIRDDASGSLLCQLNAANAETLRSWLPWLRPVPLGLKTSAGFGDRLGLATGGHVRAIRRLPGAGTSFAAIFAQQSVRENSRTGRTPQRVLDDAVWGLLQEGWREPWGADADHLKTPADIDEYAEAGYTLFTIDPGDQVDDGAESASAVELEEKLLALPWDTLEDTLGDLQRRYLGSPIALDGSALTLDRHQLWRAAVKYGRAIAHTTMMYRQIGARMGEQRFELEVSVDETSSPTTVAEHFFIAAELRRLKVRWVSLAPRFVGRFEKGVDYIGDLEAFANEFARHAAVARAFGPYKLSLHSGSDKFSLYPIVARLTAGPSDGLGPPLVHVKTAGTSYLEALRTTARAQAALFREILSFATERYETDRATYHVSAETSSLPRPDTLKDAELPLLLDHFDARQVLHVTFGSVLERFGERLHATLTRNEETYASMIEEHFTRHLAPFVE